MHNIFIYNKQSIDITNNIYRLNNEQYFNELIYIINSYRNIKAVLNRKKELLNWINNSTPLLNDPIYNVLTKVYWIIHNIINWSDVRVTCPNCGKPFINKNIYRLRLGYSKKLFDIMFK